MLNELYKVLEQRGLRFARYADDPMIYCKSIGSLKDKLIMLLLKESPKIKKLTREKYMTNHKHCL